MRYLLFILLLFTGNSFAQVPFGRIYIDLSHFNEKDSLSIIFEKNMMKQLNDKIDIGVGWINSENEIYKSWDNNSNNSNIVLLDKQHEPCTKRSNTYCNQFFFGSRVNFNYNSNAMHVIQIKSNSKKMYLYIYTGTFEERTRNGFSEITNVYFDNIKFIEGTFLINPFDENFVMTKENKNKIVDYYDISSFFLVVKSKNLKAMRVSHSSISPTDIFKFCNNPKLKRPKTIKKILSVFKS